MVQQHQKDAHRFKYNTAVNTKQNINNRLIAEFMGKKNISIRYNTVWADGEYPKGIQQSKNPVQYHTDWNALMGACYKWDNMNAKRFTKRQRNIYDNYCDLLDGTACLYKSKPVFEQLAENIKWYNTTKK